MQTLGYIIVKNEKLLVLVRQSKFWRSFKLRDSNACVGQDGVLFENEQLYLEEHSQFIRQLKSGKVIRL